MGGFRRAINPHAALLIAIWLWSLPVASVARAAGPPRFSFREGEKLTYHYSRHVLAHSASSRLKREDLEGQVVLQVQSVGSDGTAWIDMVASGNGREVSDRPKKYTRDPWRIGFDVKPNGSVVGLRDSDGNTITDNAWRDPVLDASMKGVVSAGAMIEVYTVANTYTFFGLQLPDKLPSPGGEWTGYHQSPSIDYVGQREVTRFQAVPVKFTFVGHRKYNGRDCLVFSPKPRTPGTRGHPTLLYFDTTNGRLLALESHLKNSGASKRDVDISAVLVKTE